MPVYSYQMRYGLQADIPGSPPLDYYEPLFTSDSKQLWIGLPGASTSPYTGVVVPSFYDGDLTTSSGLSTGPAEHLGRPATTKWVQDLLSASSTTPPAGIAWRTQANTFSEDNIFQKWPTITASLIPVSDSSTKIPTTQWVKNAITSAIGSTGNVAYRDQNNTFSLINTFDSSVFLNGTNTVNGPLTSSSTVDFSNGVWTRVKTIPLTNSPGQEAASTAYVWNSHTDDTKLKKTATPPASSNDTHIATTEWVKANVSGSNLLPANNTWTGTNTYNNLVTFSQVPVSVEPPLTDNSNKVPTTSWVRNTINSLATGGAPVLTKSLVSNEYNRLLWSSGTVSIAGSNYPVTAGSYDFTSANTATTTGTTYYVKAALSSGTVSIPAPTSSPSVGANEVLLGSLTLVDVTSTPPVVGGSVREINGVINNPPNYARRDIDNVFIAGNTFNGTNVLAGLTTATYSIPTTSNDTTVPTTAWVKSVLGNVGNSYFQLSGNDLVKVPNSFSGCLDLSNTCMKAKNPIDPASADNSVATTAWVQSVISNQPVNPVVSLVGTPSNTSYQVTWTNGTVALPAGFDCSGPNCDDGAGPGGTDICIVNPPSSPVTIAMPSPGTTAKKYFYVAYGDCQVLNSDTPPDQATVGKVVAIADITNSRPPSVVITPIQSGGWAPIDSPYFTGNPQAPTPPPGDCDNSLATTEFVCEALDNLLTAPCSGSITYPDIYQVGSPSLLINITNGQVPKPGTNAGNCVVTTLSAPVAVVASSTEYCWIRFSDCKLVASTQAPATSVGFLLATVVTNATNIVSITKASTAVVETKLSTCYKVGFGGRLIYVPGPNCCA